MGWLLSFASATIAALAGCALALFVAEKCVRWYRISSFEGGSGYFVIFMGLLGLVGGFFIGFAVAKTLGTGFLHGTALALGAVTGVIGIIYLLARMGGDVPPEIDGDTLELMVEMRMAPDWRPSNLALAGDNDCTLTSLGGGKRRRPSYGSLAIQHAVQLEGRWVVPCQVSIHSSRSPLLVGVRLGKKTDLEFVSPLPGHPTPKHEQWSEWMASGFAHPVGQAPTKGLEYRVRVKRDAVAAAERKAAEDASYDQRQRDFAMLNEHSPLKNWLPYATDPNNDEVTGKAQRFMATRIGDMASLLRDDDVGVVLQALEVLRQRDEIPSALHADVIAAGRRVLPLVATARQAVDPEDPNRLTEKQAKHFGEVWKAVAEKTGAPVKTVKAEIRGAASYAKSGDIFELAQEMR